MSVADGMDIAQLHFHDHAHAQPWKHFDAKVHAPARPRHGKVRALSASRSQCNCGYASPNRENRHCSNIHDRAGHGGGNENILFCIAQNRNHVLWYHDLRVRDHCRVD